jgi:hypothetical protein
MMITLSQPQLDVLRVLARRKRGRGHVQELCDTAGRRRPAVDKLDEAGFVTVEGEKPAPQKRDERLVTLTERGWQAARQFSERDAGTSVGAQSDLAASPAASAEPARPESEVPDARDGMLDYLARRLSGRSQRPHVTIYSSLGRATGALVAIGADFLAIRTESGTERVYQRRSIVHVDFQWESAD